MAQQTSKHNYEWFVIMPHHKQDPSKTGMPMSRELIMTHRERIFEETDMWLSAGVMLHEPSTELSSAKFKRTHMIVRAPSKEALVQRLREDVFAPVLWDVDNAEIEPFFSMIRTGIENPDSRPNQQHIDILSLKLIKYHKKRIREVDFEGKTAISKIAVLEWLIPQLEHETRIYEALARLQNLDGDPNRYNFTIEHSTGDIELIDLEHTGAYDEEKAMAEIGELGSELMDESGRGAPVTFMY
ncbi:hypothetical protein F66182_7635 [Fusarium sp. NRRL 66182]|nr:hypothetical protein F66182_7635 [Fusarium sp. NRRL 66182]